MKSRQRAVPIFRRTASGSFCHGNFAGKGLEVISISISLITPTGWSEPINMGANINTGFWEKFAICCTR